MVSRHRQSYRFLLTLAVLTVIAVGAAIVAELADQRNNFEVGSISARIAILAAVLIVGYVVIKLAQNVNIHSDISFQLSGAGLVFCAMILLVIILSITSGNNLLYLILSVLLAAMFVSVVGSRLSLSRIQAVVRFPDHIFAEEIVTFDINVTNRKRLLPAISIAVASQEGESPAAETTSVVELAYFPVIPARTEVCVRIERRFTTRGIYPIRGFLIGTRFPLGFIEQRRLISAEGEIVIYPAMKLTEEFLSQVKPAIGRIESRYRGSGTDLYAIRPYQASDHHHHIDWKATAKTSTLMVREFARDEDWRVTVEFDNRIPSDANDLDEFKTKFESAVSVAAGLLDYLNSQGAEIRLLAGAVDSGYGCGWPHLYAMLRLLAEIAPLIETADETAATAPPPIGAENRIRILPRQLNPLQQGDLALTEEDAK
jgi:uncharacterized protein (DUF58 family)